MRIQQAKNISKEKGQDINYFVSNAEELNINEKYDLIVSRYVFEHLPNPQKAANSIFQACKPGGQTYIIDFDGIFLNLYSSNDRLNKSLAKIGQSLQFDLFIGRKLPTLIKNAGFEKINWHAEINTFKGDQLKSEKENCYQRCLNAKPLLESILGKGRELDQFIEDYMTSLDSEETVLYYNKFIAWGKKPF